MKETLYRLFNNQYLTKTEAKEILKNMAEGKYNDSQIAAFISVYIMRNISIDEILGFREALLELCTNLDALKPYNTIDIVGTGGDNKNTFNISTAACFVVASAGYKVAKHGNYGATSLSGASNVIEQQGVKFSSNIDTHKQSLDECNFAYLHAPLFNAALKIVAPIRKNLGVRSFFNMLGPIVNPLAPERQLLGVYDLKMARLYHYIYQETNCNFSIVHSLDGYDEISLTSDFKVITKQGENIYSPQNIGFDYLTEQDLHCGDSLEQASSIFANVLCNKATPAQRNAVLANAAFAVQTMEPQMTIHDCLAKVTEAMESGKTEECLRKFVQLNS